MFSLFLSLSLSLYVFFLLFYFLSFIVLHVLFVLFVFYSLYIFYLQIFFITLVLSQSHSHSHTKLFTFLKVWAIKPSLFSYPTFLEKYIIAIKLKINSKPTKDKLTTFKMMSTRMTYVCISM